MYRILSEEIKKRITGKKSPIIVILGLRRTGKTTLTKTVLKGQKHVFFSFDLLSDRSYFSTLDRFTLEEFNTNYHDHYVVIDEVQKYPESIGVIKYLYDHHNIKFILTGSSELKLKQYMEDTLAGRTTSYRLYPLTLKEILVQNKKLKKDEDVNDELGNSLLERYLVYGSLPDLFNIKREFREKYLYDFVSDLLSKDALIAGNIRNSLKIYKLASFLALQLGSLVNIDELSTKLEISRNTVYSYLDVLEQINMIIRAYPLSTKQRKAIASKFKVYFVDNGMRNALIEDFRPINKRSDLGVLLENAIYLGIKRDLDYKDHRKEIGFFRSESGTEIDIVLKDKEKEELYEVKTNEKYDSKKGNVQYITYKQAWKYL